MLTERGNCQDQNSLTNKTESCTQVSCDSVPRGSRNRYLHICHVDEIILAEHLRVHASRRSFLYETWAVTFSLPISLCGSFNNSKIYEVTIRVPAKLPNHYCSLSTLNSNFIVLTREQWKAILRAQWNKDSYYEQCCSPLFQHILIKHQAKPLVCLPHVSV